VSKKFTKSFRRGEESWEGASEPNGSGPHFVVPSHSNTRWEKIEMQTQI
jgi:hypothetical protein